jgi:hypothetical protein
MITKANKSNDNNNNSIVTYPDLRYSNRPVDTTLNLFDAEMKYLHDNGLSIGYG